MGRRCILKNPKCERATNQDYSRSKLSGFANSLVGIIGRIEPADFENAESDEQYNTRTETRCERVNRQYTKQRTGNDMPPALPVLEQKVRAHEEENQTK